MRRLLPCLWALLLLAGCAPPAYRLTQPGRTKMGGAYSVDSGIRWSTIQKDNTELWTVNGPFLEGIQFINGIANGEALFVRDPTAKAPRFDKTMSSGEIIEFLVDSMATAGWVNVQTKNVRPAKFGNTEGIRLDLEFLGRDGLERQGMGAVAVLKEKIYIVLYTAPRSYYFNAYKSTAEAVMDSVQTE